MGVQQGDDTRVVQAAFDDVHGDLLPASGTFLHRPSTCSTSASPPR
jgi:hypothetical protein